MLGSVAAIVSGKQVKDKDEQHKKNNPEPT
jgi:hypothetical protein